MRAAMNFGSWQLKIPAEMIDTHSHMHGKEFEADFPEVLDRCRTAGVQLITLIGVNPADARKALEVARRTPGYFKLVAGLHPHEASAWSADVAASLEEISREPEVVALGEMGLDYHYDYSPRSQQKEAFLGQLQLADRLGLPVVIHCREANRDLLDMLQEYYGHTAWSAETDLPRGVLHCYFGSVSEAEEAWRLGYMLGIGGSSTFKKAEELHEVIRNAPLNQLVLETDAPYMTPVPHRGKRNDSSYLPSIAARIAELKEITTDQVVAATTANAQRLYRLK